MLPEPGNCFSSPFGRNQPEYGKTVTSDNGKGKELNKFYKG
jgi:hypothetical protein